MSRIGAVLVLGLCALGLVTSFSQQTIEPARVKALLIGNTAYRNLDACSTSKNNIAALQNALVRLGVSPQVVVLDADLHQLTASVTQFRSSLEANDLALVYYSGYAVQNEGDNYLIPVDFPAEKGDVDRQALSLGQIESDLKVTESRILIMEASRESTALSAEYPNQRLSMAHTFATGTLAASSAELGKVALPGNGPTDLFTQTLADSLQEPGLTPTQLFGRVRSSVIQTTASKQVPYIINLLVRDFFLTGAPKITETPIPPGEIRSNPRDNQQYVWVPKGHIQIGCAGEKECKEDEKPSHKVTISKGFWLGWTEVEVSTYKTYAKVNGVAMPKAPQNFNKGWNDESHPMVNVTWEDADAFCKSAGGRLPTEAEWEYAARGGIEGQKYAWGDSLTHEKANYFGTGGRDIYRDTAPVRKFDKSPWNLYDLSGNVWEWCSDWFEPDYYKKSPEVDPQGPPPPAKDPQHVKRGGSYSSAEDQLRLSFRAHWKAGDNNTGFRCVVENLPK